MPKMIQFQVPDELYAQIKAAAKAGYHTTSGFCRYTLTQVVNGEITRHAPVQKYLGYDEIELVGDEVFAAPGYKLVVLAVREDA